VLRWIAAFCCSTCWRSSSAISAGCHLPLAASNRNGGVCARNASRAEIWDGSRWKQRFDPGQCGGEPLDGTGFVRGMLRIGGAPARAHER
jgi:hypothetical protein